MPSFNGTDADNFALPGFTNYYGGDGNDLMAGDANGNQFSGGAGNDGLVGSAPLTTTGTGGTAADPLFYSNFGPSGDDFMEGGTGNDAVYGADGNDWIYGGDGDDAGIIATYVGAFVVAGLRGGDGNDFIDGGRGNDELYGENGNDILRGADGADKFLFTIAPNKITNLDQVKDFEVGVDKIVLSQAVFTGIGPTLENSEFFVGRKPHDADDRVGYNSNNGKAWWDPDGKGGAPKTLFAHLDDDLNLKFSDFALIA